MDWLSQRIGYGRWSLRANEDFSLERAKGIEQRSPGAAKDLNIGS